MIATRTIIIVCFNGVVAAFDAATGGQLWSQQDPGPLQSPSAHGTGTTGRLLYASGAQIVERSLSTGELVWSHDTGAPVQGGVAVSFKTSLHKKGALKLSPLSVIAGDEAGMLLALSVKKGKQPWAAAGPGPIQDTSPAIADGVVYVAVNPGPGQDEGSLEALDVSSGRVLLSAPLGRAAAGTVSAPSPSVADGRVYVGAFDGGLRVFGLGGPAG